MKKLNIDNIKENLKHYLDECKQDMFHGFLYETLCLDYATYVNNPSQENKENLEYTYEIFNRAAEQSPEYKKRKEDLDKRHENTQKEEKMSEMLKKHLEQDRERAYKSI